MSNATSHYPVLDTTIPQLGTPRIPTMLPYINYVGHHDSYHINLVDETLDEELACQDIDCQTLTFEKAGPREQLYFDASKTRCAIVTCGGICPGINDVIRAIVQCARNNYGISTIHGISYGLQGFIPKYGHPTVDLTLDFVSNIHEFGGTVLGSSRGPQPADEIVDTLERLNINALFIIGGDGTLRAAKSIVDEITNRGLKISVIGIPKTIDNDINMITKSFGFETAVEKTTEAIHCAHVEATGVNRGIGLVKVMGRESGFIAARAAFGMQEVDFVLVPECPFPLEGEHGLYQAVERRLDTHKHALILCAEGAGQEYCDESENADASGNKALCDFPRLLKKGLADYFAAKGADATIKYIDPSYIIRSVPANTNDRVYCNFLGQHAVHAAMSGKTGMVVTQILSRYVHVPLGLVTRKRRRINLRSEFWRAVVESSGQRLLDTSNGLLNGIIPLKK